jgi:threonine/homoserine/homoserine lactone efflux protein
MNAPIYIFLLTSLISFIGSIQLGAVNVAVIQTTLNHNLKAGMRVGLGGCFPEMIYTFIVIEGNRYVQNQPLLVEILQKISIPLFLGIGIYQFWHKPAPVSFKEPSVRRYSKDIIKGFILGISNPQLLPFWALVLLYVDSFFKINTFSTKLAFISGAAFGALLVLYTFSYLTFRYQSRIITLFKQYPIRYIIGFIFILLAFVQVIYISF